MRGGEAIAYGSDGCIFTPRLITETRADGLTYAKESGEAGVVSKVFLSRIVADNEYKLLREIKNTTGGVGAITYIGNVEAFDVLESSVPEIVGYKLVKTTKQPTTCAKIRDAATATKKYMIHMERITGDLRDKDDNSIKPSAFLDAWNALVRLHRRKEGAIFHLDLARRNIFMKGDSAILGDYGSGYMDNGPESFDDFVQRFVKRYSIDIGSISGGDGISPELTLALSYYNRVYLNKEKPEDFKDAYMTYLPVLQEYSIIPEIPEAISTTYWAKMDDVFGKLTAAPDIKAYILTLAAGSDIKMFMASILPKLDLGMIEKETLLKEVLINDNFKVLNDTLRGTIPPAAPVTDITIDSLRARLEALRAKGGGGRKSKHRKSQRRLVGRRRKTVRRRLHK